ncbi:hypothetical protein [Cupriavidus agavae]|uniref:DUF4398 domain-containing protein n=1 Tax=Cupriavidus agavae TaxID=1001822 RepID=A0A4Q7RZ37_9BURK|nr:hypothetical protein [Cupriavidus agavae]RZT39156.1 hypothetical protein EV147_2351 [Cupriavidus agavae]
MKNRIGFIAASALALSLVSGCAVADVGYYAERHPNIEAASVHAEQAIERMQAAQRANHYALGGHAGRAIALLHQAQAEMEAAAATASSHAY